MCGGVERVLRFGNSLGRCVLCSNRGIPLLGLLVEHSTVAKPFGTRALVRSISRWANFTSVCCWTRFALASSSDRSAWRTKASDFLSEASRSRVSITATTWPGLTTSPSSARSFACGRGIWCRYRPRRLRASRCPTQSRAAGAASAAATRTIDACPGGDQHEHGQKGEPRPPPSLRSGRGMLDDGREGMAFRLRGRLDARTRTFGKIRRRQVLFGH